MPVAECPGRFGTGAMTASALCALRMNYGDADAFNASSMAPMAGPRRHSRRRLQPPGSGRQLPAIQRPIISPIAIAPIGASRSISTAPNPRQVREFFLGNACYWIREFHLDGLRLDATQNIYDSGRLTCLPSCRAAPAPWRQPRRICPRWRKRTPVQRASPVDPGGFGLDAMWNDDFHHTARVALTGRREATTRTTAARRRNSSPL